MTDQEKMKAQAERNARKAFHQAEFVAPHFEHATLAHRAAVANFEVALRDIEVAMMFAFSEITGEYWSGGKVQ